MDYWLQVDHCEGPIDLLFLFIQRDILNIYDIPIANISREYLQEINSSHFLHYPLG